MVIGVDVSMEIYLFGNVFLTGVAAATMHNFLKDRRTAAPKKTTIVACLKFHPGLDPGQCPSRLLAAHARFNRRLLRSMINDGHPERNRMV